MPERKVVNDFEEEIKQHLAAIKLSGTMRPNATAIHELAVIYEQVTGDPVCLTCSSYLAKVYKYFIRHARNFA